MHYRIVTLTTPEPKEWTMSSQGLSVGEMIQERRIELIDQRIEELTVAILTNHPMSDNTAKLCTSLLGYVELRNHCERQLAAAKQAAERFTPPDPID